MPLGPDWRAVDLPEIDTLPSPVFLRSQRLPARHSFLPHTHRWRQLVYATAGALLVQAPDTWCVITPEQAVWLPTGVLHATGALHDAEFRNLYVDAALALDMPEHCQVLAATPLLRALIVELDAIGQRQESADYTARVQQLIVDQLPRLPRQDVHLPWPKGPQLRTLCEALYAQPADPRDLPAWGAALGASARTLSRRFERELGISLRDWRTRLRLIRALEWLGAGRAVTDVALELGYASPSAFSHMFRQAMGCSPSDWRRGECG